MARTLEQLNKRYAKSLKPGSEGRGMMPRRGPGGPRQSGKPKDTAKTVSRMLSYVAKYKGRLLLVVLCMLVSTITSLIGSYMLAPIIDRITLEVKPDAHLNMSAIERFADGVINRFIHLGSGIMGEGHFSYV